MGVKDKPGICYGTINNFRKYWRSTVFSLNDISALLHKNCQKKQETLKVILRSRAYNYLQGTYTPQGGTILSPAFLPVYRG